MRHEFSSNSDCSGRDDPCQRPSGAAILALISSLVLLQINLVSPRPVTAEGPVTPVAAQATEADVAKSAKSAKANKEKKLELTEADKKRIKEALAAMKMLEPKLGDDSQLVAEWRILTKQLTGFDRPTLTQIRPSFSELPGFDPNDIRMIPVAATLPAVDKDRIERVLGMRDFRHAQIFVGIAKWQSIVGRVKLKAMHQVPGGVFYPGQGWGTGFLVADDILMTNNHVIPSKTFADIKVQIQFNYQRQLSTGKLLNHVSYDLDPDDFFYTNKALDFTLVRVKPEATSGESPGRRWGSYPLSRSMNPVLYFKKPVYIIQHPDGRPKEIVIDNNLLMKERQSDFLLYTTDTEPGSSGSPAFDFEWKIIALHHAAGEKKDGKWVNNEGVRMTSIIDHVRKRLPEARLTELGLTKKQ